MFHNRKPKMMAGTALTIAALVLTAACSHRRPEAPRWSGPAMPAPSAPGAPVVTPPIMEPAPTTYMASAPEPAPPQPVAVRSFTTGCNGSYTIVDGAGRHVQAGRAYNTGSGLVALDSRGNRGAAVTQAGAGQTLLFLPDCGCQARADTGDATRMASTETAAGVSCAAG
jgi:hypothetical protein